MSKLLAPQERKLGKTLHSVEEKMLVMMIFKRTG